jgi:glycosyltransferase involved in cell wall biosynthesis
VRSSVIVITHNESARLALTLAGLEAAPPDTEIVVVDDGSSDGTAAVIERAAARRPIVVVSHQSARGRSAARNAGAAVANGDLLVFVDGDVVVAPDLVARHEAAYAAAPDTLGRGEQYHLRCTRFFLDPRTGTPMPGQEERVARRGDLAKQLVTEDQIRADFTWIARRAEVGLYPGAGPRRLAEVELAGLRAGSRIGWVAASGHNFSVPRARFDAVGGYDPELTMNEHRELALRLVQRGGKVRVVDGARSYHLTHRSGWRDPLEERAWERRFWAKHPIPAVALLAVFWRSLAEDPRLPPAARLVDLAEFEAAAAGGYDWQAVRRAHPDLGALP